MKKLKVNFTLTGESSAFKPICEICMDSGMVEATGDQINDPSITKIIDYKTVEDNGRYIDQKIYKVDCQCVLKRKLLRNLTDSGLRDVIDRYKFDKYVTDTDYRKSMKKTATAFVQSQGRMLAILGQSGVGKTHLCSATTIALMKKGYEAHYMIWVDAVEKAKSNYRAFDDDYIAFLKRVKVLYVDDFLKTPRNTGNISDWEFMAAFSIINKRKENKGLITILSSELSLANIANIDVALAGRIKELSGEFLIDIPHKKDGNWRLRI